MRGKAATFFYLLVACCYGMDIHSQRSLAPWMKQCVAVDGYLSPYVRAYRTRRPQVVGCEVGRGSASAREVHVLNVLQKVERVDGGRPHVTVRLEPNTPTGAHQGPLVLVLVAPSPVVWRISSERLSNTSRVVFWVRTGSRVKKLNPLRHKVKVEALPAGREQLIAWVNSKYRTLTSYTETPHVNRFTRRLGATPGRQGTDNCVPTENFESTNLDLTFLESRPTHACSVSENEDKDKDIHVIEILPTTNSTPSPSEVRLDITMTTRAARRRHLLLLLKANHDVTWRIRAIGMRGDLDIKAQMDNHVNTEEVDPEQTVRVTMEQLTQYTGTSLRQWAISKEGKLVSFTQSSGADTINLIIDGTAGGRGVAGAQDDQHVAAGSTPGTAGPDDGPGLPFINRSPFRTPAKTRAALNQAKHVHCTSRSMEVLLRKHILRLYGVRQEHLSLLAPECMAYANQTHYILHTELDTCGTQGYIDVDSMAYQNAILLHDIDLSNAKDDLGSADLSELRSLLESDHTRVDDEDYSAATDADGQIRVDFRCDYPIGAPDKEAPIVPEDVDLGTGQPAPQVGDRRFSLLIYKDETYDDVFTQWPLRLARDDVVYVQAEMSGDENFNLLLQNCWVGATKYMEPNGRRLIEQGCAKDPDVHVVQTSSIRVRFSFRYKETLTSSRAFVGCQLTVCAPNESARMRGVPVCKPRTCVQTAPQPAGTPRPTSLKTAFTGPLDPPRPWSHDGGENRTPQDSGTPDTAHACQEVIHVEGLDSGTVVGISFATFIIGVLLTAALWVIHTHTGPYRAANRPRSTETSGESTPSSTAPITIHHIHT